MTKPRRRRWVSWVQYALCLVAVAYLGMGATWHAGPSGSVPLLFATPGSFMIKGTCRVES